MGKSLFPIDVSVRGVFIICFIVREFFNDDGCAKRRSSFNFFSALREQLRTQSPANILLRLHARFGLAEKPIIGLRCYPREFFCLSQWLGAYAFYPQHIAFGPLVQCGSFPQGAAVFIADRIMLEGKRFWLLLLPALELVVSFASASVGSWSREVLPRWFRSFQCPHWYLQKGLTERSFGNALRFSRFLVSPSAALASSMRTLHIPKVTR